MGADVAGILSKAVKSIKPGTIRFEYSPSASKPLQNTQVVSQTSNMVNVKNLAIAASALFSITLAAPVIQESSVAGEQGKVIEGSYIITLKSGTADLESHLGWVKDVHRRSLGRRQFTGVEKTYSGSYDFSAYSGSFDSATIEEIRNNPDVCLVLQYPELLTDMCRSPMLRKTRSGLSTSSVRSLPLSYTKRP